jgi:hypothetical protein
MAVVVYDLDRNVSDDSPFAEVVGFQKYRVNSKTTYAPSPTSSSPSYPQAQCPIRSRFMAQTSLSCALNPESTGPPAYTPTPATATSMGL